MASGPNKVAPGSLQNIGPGAIFSVILAPCPSWLTERLDIYTLGTYKKVSKAFYKLKQFHYKLIVPF